MTRLLPLIALLLASAPGAAADTYVQSVRSLLEKSGLGFKIPWKFHVTEQVAYRAAERSVVLSVEPSYLRTLTGQLEEKIGTKLKPYPRAESVVISEREVTKILKPHVSMKDLHELAAKRDFQRSRFSVVCLGRAEDDYFLLLNSEDLFRFRDAVFDLYVERGGNPSRWDPHDFHLTIGLGTGSRERRETDGFAKGRNSCFAEIQDG